MRVAAAIVFVLVLALPGWSAQPQHASLELSSRSPLTVQGRGFGRLEAVTLTATAAGTGKSITVTARRNGKFRAGLGLRLSRCAPFVVRAVGSRGSRAVLQVEPGCIDGKPPKARARP